MPKISPMEALLTSLLNPYRGNRRTEIDDLREYLEEHADIIAAHSTKRLARDMAITFDRKKNDASFSYWLFDELLLHLDRYAGGQGIRKPINQMRILSWKGDPVDLMSLVKRLCQGHPRLSYRGLLVLPYPTNASGHRINRRIYRR